MKLFSAILKLITVLNLTDSEEFQTLHNDVKKWELEKAHKDTEDQIGKMYYNLHKGVLFRLIVPFLYYFALKEVRTLMNGGVEEGEDF